MDLDPKDFTANIDNPYWPMVPGTQWTYRETDQEGAEQEVVVTVTDQMSARAVARPGFSRSCQ